MKRLVSFSILALVTLFSCTQRSPDKTITIEEIRSAELAFAKMAQDEGVEAAFLAFAADSCVVMRRNQLYKGKEGLRELFVNASTTAQLDWAPDFVDVAQSGDLGYTYGRYVYADLDSTGAVVKSEGIFHTVWKRQSDGTWKFVWD